MARACCGARLLGFSTARANALRVFFFAGARSLANWLAGFTDLLDRHNPEAIARGFAVWGAAVQVAVVGTLIAVAALEPNLGATTRRALAIHGAALSHWSLRWVSVAGRLALLPTVALLPRQAARIG